MLFQLKQLKLNYYIDSKGWCFHPFISFTTIISIIVSKILMAGLWESHCCHHKSKNKGKFQMFVLIFFQEFLNLVYN